MIYRSTITKNSLPEIPTAPRQQSASFDGDEEAHTNSRTPTSRDKRALFFASLFGFSFALYLSFLAVGARNAWQRSKALDIEQDADVSSRWDRIGRNYDDEIEMAEKAMFMGRKRRRLISQAKGDILEVSVGTGRNMEYYDLGPAKQQDNFTGRIKNVTSIVFNDKAGVMVEAAKKKFEKQEARKLPAQRFQGQVTFVGGDAGIPGVIERPDAGFDTIVQTMGLCSTTDPVGFLRTLGKLCKRPSQAIKPTNAGNSKHGQEEAENDYTGARILLLEHGRGYHDWLNNVLDGLAAGHADHYGCWWNRDIGAIVQESGLEVESIKRYHLGTTWELVLRPRPQEEAAQDLSSKQSEKSGTFTWISKVIPW